MAQRQTTGSAVALKINPSGGIPESPPSKLTDGKSYLSQIEEARSNLRVIGCSTTGGASARIVVRQHPISNHYLCKDKQVQGIVLLAEYESECI